MDHLGHVIVRLGGVCVLEDVIWRPADDEDDGDDGEHDGHALDGRLGLVLENASVSQQVAHQESIAEHHDDDGDDETDEQLEVGPEPQMAEEGVRRPEHPAAICAVMVWFNVKIHPVWRHDDRAGDPQEETHQGCLSHRAVTHGAKW